MSTSNSKKHSFGSEELLQEAHSTLHEQLKVIEASFKKLMDSADEITLHLYTLLFSIYDSCKSILILTPHYQVREIFVTARTIFELTLNIGYISALGKPALEKAQRHMHQKEYRDLERQLNIESMNLSVKTLGLENLKVDKQLQNALDEYTNQKGLEVKSWTGDNVFRKIDFISKTYGQKVKDILNIGLFNIYRHASEIAHGTLFGLFYIIGATSMKKRPNDTNELLVFHRQHLTLTILTVCMLIEANLTFMNSANNLSEEIKLSENLTLKLASKSDQR
jgi:hypothetical protein